MLRIFEQMDTSPARSKREATHDKPFIDAFAAASADEHKQASHSEVDGRRLETTTQT
jgi:hypothetical protein